MKRKRVPGGAVKKAKRRPGAGKYGQVFDGQRPAYLSRVVMPRASGETKILDVINATNGAAQVSVAMVNVPLIFCINAVTIGAGAWNRIGRKITMKSLYLQGWFSGAIGTTVACYGMNARILIVYDKQTNGAAPVIADIIADQINNTGGDVRVTALTSGINMNNRERFEVILDKRFWLPGITAAGGQGINSGATNGTVEEFRNLRGRETQFRSDTVPSTVADIASGSLLMITMSDVAATQAPWQFTFSSRLKYKDY